MLRLTKCRPLFLKMFHSFEHCSVSWWTGFRFKLILLERNNNKWEDDFKFWYLNFEYFWNIKRIWNIQRIVWFSQFRLFWNLCGIYLHVFNNYNTLRVRGLIFDVLYGCFSNSLWFYVTAVVIIIDRFVLAFMFFSRSGESIYDGVRFFVSFPFLLSSLSSVK